MVDDYPENYALIMGLAHLLNNKGIYEEAMEYYTRVIKMKPSWVRPLECIAYIYEYKRINKTKVKEIANSLLELEANNRVALFVLGRNQATPDEKIEELKKMILFHPKFARAFNEIGIAYGAGKK